MHIKEIIIDGFKSYSVKTNINYFDPHFNAITGLNGSGKSNILDAICFVLGITSLSHVRASNLNELIYKYGQAGINKASVTIIFDNSDRKYQPLACEDYDEIIVTRTIYQSKSKYYLNGYNATQENIKSLFQSVKLNINNPHFLIMQGKVTQVVNMKPLEILGLLEEAAGTSMYELKKDAALKTIKKKENKLEEINKTLAEEITPQLEKLLRDKQNYLTWKSRENEIARITKLLTAAEYYNALKILKERNSEMKSLKASNHNLNQEITQKNNLIENLKKDLLSIENVCKKGNNQVLNELEASHKSLINQCKVNKQKYENLKITNNNSVKEINKLENENSQIEISVDNLNKAKLDKHNSITALEKDFELRKNLLNEYERNLENIKLGKVNQEAEIHKINKIINETKNNLNNFNAEKNTLGNQIRIFEEQRAVKKQKLNEYKKGIEQIKKQATNVNKQINDIKQELGLDISLMNLNDENNNLHNPIQIENLKKEISDYEVELQKLDQKKNDYLSRLASRVDFNFRDPEPNFDRNKVKGKVIRLFSFENDNYAIALEQCAGGRLFNIVTDTEKTSSLLISRKCFDFFQTFIPNNKIVFKETPSEIKRLVNELVGNQARLAIDLIQFDKELLPSMQYVFGNTWICNSTEVAKKISYNDRIRARCVNLEGDVFDPQGLITGGSIQNSDNLLIKVKELNFIQNKIFEYKRKVNDKRLELNSAIEKMGMNHQLKMKLEALINQKNELSEEKINKNILNFENDILRTDEEVKRLEEKIISLAESENKYGKELEKLIKELEEFKKNGTSKELYNKKIKENKNNLTEIENNIKTLKNNVTDLEINIKRKRDKFDENLEK